MVRLIDICPAAFPSDICTYIFGLDHQWTEGPQSPVVRLLLALEQQKRQRGPRFQH
jgi:hypothetical protein